MSRFSVVRNILLTRRRTYTSLVLESMGVETSKEEPKKDDKVSSAARRETQTSQQNYKRRQVFWMRDPRTGYWMPETHFTDPDVAQPSH
ncbi:hypothetical protein vseg_004058 [Gypsophila vaccaria]